MLEVKISSEGALQTWSRDNYRHNFDNAYRELFASSGANSSSAALSTVGGKEVSIGAAAAKRWIQYERIANRMCIHEVCLQTDLKNSSACIVFGDDADSSILAVDAFAQAEKGAVSLCVSLSNGSFYTLSLPVSDDATSILSPIVEGAEGRLFQVGNVISAEEKGSGSGYSWFTGTYNLNSIDPRKDTIYSSAWASAQSVLFGLTGGDIIAASIDGEADCSEHVLRGASAGALRALWSGFSGASASSNEAVTVETVNIPAPRPGRTGDGSYALSISMSSSVKLWNLKTGQCLLTQSLARLSAQLAHERGDDKAGFIHAARVALCDAANTYAPVDGCASIMALLAVDISIRGLRSWQILHVVYTVPLSGSSAESKLISVLCPPPVGFGNSSNVYHAPIHLLDIQFSCDASGAVAVWHMAGGRALSHSFLHGHGDEGHELFVGSPRDTSTPGTIPTFDYRAFHDVTTIQLEPVDQVPAPARVLDIDSLGDADSLELTARCIRHIFQTGRCAFGAVQSVLEQEFSGVSMSGGRILRKRQIDPPPPPSTVWTEEAIVSLTREVVECVDLRAAEISSDDNCSFFEAKRSVFIDFISRCESRQLLLLLDSASANGGLVRFGAAGQRQQQSFALLAASVGRGGGVDLVVAPSWPALYAPAPEPSLGIDLAPVCKHVLSAVSSRWTERQIIDLDLYLAEYFSVSADITNDNSSWLDSRLRQLALSMQDLCPSLARSVQNIAGDEHSLFDALLQLISIDAGEGGDDGSMDTDDCRGSSSIGSYLSAEVAKSRVFELYRTAQCVCVTLVLLSDPCLLASSVPLLGARADVAEPYLRGAKSRLLQLALLLWFDSIRPCRRALQLVDMIDFQGICQSYLLLSSPSPVVSRKIATSQSLWANFHRLRLPSAAEGPGDVSSIALTLTGAVSRFLAQAGQFSALRRWLSLLALDASSATALEGSAELCSLQQTSSALAFASLMDALSAVHTANLGAEALDLESALEVRSRADTLLSAVPAASSSNAAEEVRSLLGDEAFKALVEQAPASGPVDLLSASSCHFLSRARFMFDAFARISHLTDSLEALKRVLIVLPRELASEIILDASYAVVDAVVATSEAIVSAAGVCAESRPFLIELSALTSTGWRQAFESALEAGALDDALSALKKIVALLRSEQAANPNPAAQGRRWGEQQLVSALAARACAEGRAGWLLSLPHLLADTGVEGDAVDLTALLAAELERLATVSDVSGFLLDPRGGPPHSSPLKGHSSPASSHYEVLLALLLRHQDFREVARVAASLYQRLRGDGLASKYPSVLLMSAQSRALLIAIHAQASLPLSQQPALAAADSGSAPAVFGGDGLEVRRGLEDALRLARARGLIAPSLAARSTTSSSSSEDDLDLVAAMCQQGLLTPPVSLLAASGDVAAQKVLADRTAAHYSTLLASCLRGDIDVRTQQLVQALALSAPFSAYASSSSGSSATVVTDALVDLIARHGGAAAGHAVYARNIPVRLVALALVHGGWEGGASDAMNVFTSKGMFAEAAEVCIALLNSLLAAPPAQGGAWLPLNLIDEVLHGLGPRSRDAQLLSALLKQFFTLNLYSEL